MCFLPNDDGFVLDSCLVAWSARSQRSHRSQSDRIHSCSDPSQNGARIIETYETRKETPRRPGGSSRGENRASGAQRFRLLRAFLTRARPPFQLASILFVRCAYFRVKTVPGAALAAPEAELPPFLRLPSELLLDIINRVADPEFNETAKQDLEALLCSCRRIYVVGLPLLVREINLGRDGAAKLRSLVGGPTGIDKTPFVRSISVPQGLHWSENLLKVLEKCLVNVEHFKLETIGAKVVKNIWAKLVEAPMLRSLELDLSDDAVSALGGAGQFPSNVRSLTLRLRGKCDVTPLYRMLENLPFPFESFHLDDIACRSRPNRLAFPILSSRVTSLVFRNADLFHAGAAAFTALRSLELVQCSWYTNDPALRQGWLAALSHFTRLESLRLHKIRTYYLLGLKPRLPNLSSLTVDDTKFSMLPADRHLISAEFGVLDLEVTIHPLPNAWDYPGDPPERRVWQSLSNARFV